MDMNAIRAIANVILYEGYMLYPYRPSALKNRSQGWTFGTLLPEHYAASHPGEPAHFVAELLITGVEPQLSAEVRFLHLCDAEARERTVNAGPFSVPDLIAGVHVPFAISAAEGNALQGTVRISGHRIDNTAAKVTIAVYNQSPPALAWECRDQALQQALVSAHALMTISGGEFVSLLSPPDELRAAAEGCRHTGVFPVLAGLEGDRTAVLISPIILYDYPQIASSSHGDFFDSSEIDEMLTLRVLTLTDAEKEEVRAANQHARALVQRTESLSPEEILKLHGVLRGLSRAED